MFHSIIGKAWLVSCLSVVFGVGLSLSIAGQDKAGQDKKADPPAKTDKQAKQDDTTKQEPPSLTEDQTIMRLMASVDQLLPGPFDEKSDRYQQLLKVCDHFRNRRPADSAATLDKLGEADKAFPPTSLLMAGLYFTVNDANTGRAFLERTAIEHPEYPATYAGFARIAVSTGRITDAAALMTVMKSKIDAGTWTQQQSEQFDIEWLDIMTDVAMARNRHDEANGYLTRLKTHLPDNGKVYLRQAEVAFKQEKIEAAIDLLKLAREKQDNVLVPPLVIANWFRQANDKENLEKWINQAAGDHPTDRNVQLEFSRWLIQQNKLAKANIWINRAEENGANEFTTAFMKGQVAFLRKSFDVAELHFSRIQNAQPANVEATNLLALSLVESGNIDKQRKALELATVSVRMAPQNVVSISVLGWVYLKIGDRQRAAQHLQRAAQSPRLPPEAAFFVAMLLADQKRNADALKVLEAIASHKSVFLYRSQAEELTKKIKSEQQALDNSNPKDGKQKSDKNDK